MSTNLFELLDGLFRGIIYFFYNFVETAYRVIQRPTGGPLLLFRKHRNPAHRQIGGLTFLFLSFFGLLTFWLLFLQDSNARGLGMLSRTISDLPDLEAKSLWPMVAGALLSTVMVDAPIRLFLWWKLSHRRLRREIILGSVHYATFVPVLVGLGGSILALRTVEADWFPWRETNLVLTSSVVIPVLLMAWLVRPAAALLGKAFTPRGGRPRDARTRRRIRQLLLTALFYGAILAGGATAITLEGERQDRAEALRHLRIIGLRCVVQDRNLAVWAVVWNPSQEPAVLDPSRVRASVGQFVEERGFERESIVWSYNMAWLGLKDEPHILRSGETLLLSGQSDLQGHRPSREDRCLLTSPGPDRRIMGVSEQVEYPGPGLDPPASPPPPSHSTP